jgi:hypothetical protein
MSQELQDQITGLDARLKELRAVKDRFVKAQGLEEESEKARQEIGELEIDLQAVKEELSELRDKKAQSLGTTTGALSDRISEGLPAGRGVMEISEDNEVWIGWEKEGRRRPYVGLSGGEKAVFGAAMANALLGTGPKTLIVEAGEIDGDQLVAAMERLAGLPEEMQVLLMSWHRPYSKPAGWLGWKETSVS